MKQELARQLAAAIERLYGVTIDVELTRPDAEHGDYATNVAMQLTGRLGKNPRDIGESLALALRDDVRFQAVTVAGPGFLNLTLTDTALMEALGASTAPSAPNRIVLVEYSDPNPFKPLHAGHLYTTLVGDAIARLIERSGAKTIRLNFGGDVGLHAGKSMWAIIHHLGGEYPDRLGDIREGDRPAWLGARYVEGNAAYEDDETAKNEIITCNKRVYALHEQDDHDSPFARIYWQCREWSYRYFATLYEQLQVAPFDRFIPESEVTPLGLRTVQEQLSRGVFVHSDGAVVYRGDEGKGLHTRVFINKDGIPTYETKDVGLSLMKWQDYHFDESIIITANEQEQYMRVVIAAIHEFAPEPADRTRHITHGVVKLAGGVKMSSRKGNIVSALDILTAAREAAKATQANASEETMLAAVKYAFIKNRIGGDIIYDPAESVALEGNSGPYLQYAHARARSIITKAAAQGTTEDETQPETDSATPIRVDFTPDERLLVRKLTEYTETLERATSELLPHYICTYLYELAQEFNRFYEKNRVIGDERTQIRLRLVTMYADTLKQGLELLGIHAPEKM